MSKAANKLLTIAIPTYNREGKLRSTLARIGDMIRSSQYLQENIEVIVSNNASTDNTLQVLEEFDKGTLQFCYFNQKENIGFDGNMRFLYESSNAEYVWYFSDDDVLFSNAIERVLDAVKSYSPEALLFSFVQPVGSTVRLFDYSDTVAVIDEPLQMIKLIAQSPKLSIYVYKRIRMTEQDWADIDQFFGSNYHFITLGYSILWKSASPKLCVISEPLAGCDVDFNKIRFSPETWGNYWVVYRHPYVKMVAPALEISKRQEAYYNQIQALFAVKTGVLEVEEIVASAYDEFAQALEFRWIWLFRSPKSLGQIACLKFGLVHMVVEYILAIKMR